MTMATIEQLVIAFAINAIWQAASLPQSRRSSPEAIRNALDEAGGVGPQINTDEHR